MMLRTVFRAVESIINQRRRLYQSDPGGNRRIIKQLTEILPEPNEKIPSAPMTEKFRATLGMFCGST